MCNHDNAGEQHRPVHAESEVSAPVERVTSGDAAAGHVTSAVADAHDNPAADAGGCDAKSAREMRIVL